MLNRWIGIVCALFMLGANTTLFVRDILPRWLAGNPPELDDLSHGTGPERRVQTGIYNADRELVGRNWWISKVQGEFLNVTSLTMLYPINLPNGMATPRVRIETQLRYQTQDGFLGELVLTIRGLPAAIVLRGELVPPDEFACKWWLGYVERGHFVLDAQATRAIGDVLRPFTRLPGLYVGRTWRVQLLDPLSRIVPGLQAEEFLGDAEFVRVVRTETIEHLGRPVEAFVVEAARTRAWVAPQGDVLRQEVELPFLGKLTLYDEPYDDAAYREAKQWSARQGQEALEQLSTAGEAEGEQWLPTGKTEGSNRPPADKTER
jgi:hypothetical protein